jgi:DNA-binding NarL/FixJ family response regulator
MRVLLADDEPKVRAALRLILEQLKEVEIVGDVDDAASLISQIRQSRPDLLLLDWELPGLRPGLCCTELRQQNQPLKVIVLSGRCPAPQSVLASGADAFISKGESPDRLFATLRAMGAD